MRCGGFLPWTESSVGWRLGVGGGWIATSVLNTRWRIDVTFLLLQPGLSASRLDLCPFLQHVEAAGRKATLRAGAD
jgi:hypothetical protein